MGQGSRAIYDWIRNNVRMAFTRPAGKGGISLMENEGGELAYRCIFGLWNIFTLYAGQRLRILYYRRQMKVLNLT